MLRVVDAGAPRSPAHRLVDWQASDGWEPLCRALALPVPDEPLPHRNTWAEWNA
jgi:hypothetical protein